MSGVGKRRDAAYGGVVRRRTNRTSQQRDSHAYCSQSRRVPGMHMHRRVTLGVASRAYAPPVSPGRGHVCEFRCPNAHVRLSPSPISQIPFEVALRLHVSFGGLKRKGLKRSLLSHLRPIFVGYVEINQIDIFIF